jgi:hypothetical protein
MVVTDDTTRLMKIRDTPSTIHSMVMILLLSGVMFPNFLITDLVGNRWAIPQKRIKADPK